MEIKLVLDGKKLIRLPDTIISGEKVVVAFESAVYGLGKLGVTVSNGKKVKTYVLEDDFTLDITEFCDRACRVDIKAELIVQYKTVKEWVIEPIVVRELDKGFEVIPEIQEMRNRLVRMEKILIEFNNKLKEFM